MAYKYIFDPVALLEFKEAVEWYGERSSITVNNFITSLNEKINDICETPALYRITYKEYREISLKKFPYSIVYLVNDKSKIIVITSIYHHKRSPKRKYKK